MKLIIKNYNIDIVKNPNVKIIETTEASFTNQIVFIEENDVPIIKYTDTESMYFIKDLDNLYDRKSRSEVLLNITTDNLELIGGGNSEPVDSRPYKVYTALLTQSGTDAPVATVLENTLGGDLVWYYLSLGQYSVASDNLFVANKTSILATSFADEIGSSVTGNIVSLDTISIFVTDSSNAGADNLLQQGSTIEIRVYN